MDDFNLCDGGRRRFERALAYLLSPKSVVETGLRYKLRMSSLLYDAPSLKHINSLGMHYC